MSKWAAAAVSALPVFLLGCVFALVVFQFRLASLQAATAGYGLPTAATSAANALSAAQRQHAGPSGSTASSAATPAAAAAAKDTLVLYILNEDDPLFRENFDFFLLAGVQEDSRCSYVVIVQLKSFKSAAPLPELPAVQYIYYGGGCYDWGMVGWALQSGQVKWQSYQYFILLSSAVRGPFLPSYLEGVMHWTQPFLSRLKDRVKLVGPVVSCVPAPSDPTNSSAPWATNPSLPLHGVATDREGLDLMIAAGVLSCHTSVWQEKYSSELRAASALFDAGHTIDCLAIRYQGVDWAQAAAQGCNRAWDPTGPGDAPYDGIALDPMEVLFVRVNSPMREARVPSVLKAIKFSQWALGVAAEAAGVPVNTTARVTNNDYADNRGLYKMPRLLTTFVRGRRCFDMDFFISRNRDFFGPAPLEQIDSELAWRFFVHVAQFEDRPFRFTCPMNYSIVALPAF